MPEPERDTQTGEEWFAEQNEATQRRVLGPAKYEAYRAGDITLGDLAGLERSARWGASNYERSLTEVVGAGRAAELIAAAREGA